MLKLENVCAFYDQIQVLHKVNLEVNEGEIVCLIGANGAGKTTTIKTITGMLTTCSGSINFLGKNIRGSSMSTIVKLGISCVPEGRRIFPKMTVIENLELGAYVHRKDPEGSKPILERIWEIFPVLFERQKQLGGTLSGGEQQMLALARAMMSRPKLILMDEPTMGLAPILVEQTFQAIKRIKEEGTTILLVEQNAQMAFEISDRAYLLQTGNIVMSGKSSELAADPQVHQTYLSG